MKQILLILVCCPFLKTFGQEVKPAFDGKKWEAPYILDTIKGGDIERFLIPIQFAPSIPYKGVEDIRFMPGWSKKETNEYWSYAFLWYLDGMQTFDNKTIEKNLITYYTGLIGSNVDKNKVAIDKLQIKASIKQQNIDASDSQIFKGTVDMPDFMTLKPISLNFLIHITYRKDLDKTFVFHEASPQPFDNDVWKTLDQLWTNFKFTKE